MKKYQGLLCEEVYTVIEVEANSEDEARDLIMQGEGTETDDVTRKNGDVIQMSTLVNTKTGEPV